MARCGVFYLSMCMGKQGSLIIHPIALFGGRSKKEEERDKGRRWIFFRICLFLPLPLSLLSSLTLLSSSIHKTFLLFLFFPAADTVKISLLCQVSPTSHIPIPPPFFISNFQISLFFLLTVGRESA